VIDFTLNTRRKRHLAAGILASISLMFGGLALTVITIKKEETDNENKE
jgi:hypothetical protein